MSVGSQALAINPSLCDSIGGLLLGEAEHLGNHSSASNLDKHNMVQTDLVVRVQKCQTTLNFVCPDHSLQNLLDGNDLSISKLSTCTVGSRDPVSDSQDRTQVIRRVTPFSGEPAVVVVEPSNHSTDVESAIDGVELERCAGDLCAVGDDSSLNNGAEELCAFLESQTFETAAKGVEENESSGVELETQLAGSFTRLKGSIRQAQK